MDGIFLKFMKIACREILNYPKYISQLPKGDTGKHISNTPVRIPSKSFDKLLDHHNDGIYYDPFCMCCTKKEKYYPMQKPVAARGKQTI